MFRYKCLNFGFRTLSESYRKRSFKCRWQHQYYDDIIVGVKTKAEHDARLDQVIKRLSDSGLTLDAAKYDLITKKLDFFDILELLELTHLDTERISTQPKYQY